MSSLMCAFLRSWISRISTLRRSSSSSRSSLTFLSALRKSSFTLRSYSCRSLLMFLSCSCGRERGRRRRTCGRSACRRRAPKGCSRGEAPSQGRAARLATTAAAGQRTRPAAQQTPLRASARSLPSSPPPGRSWLTALANPPTSSPPRPLRAQPHLPREPQQLPADRNRAGPAAGPAARARTCLSSRITSSCASSSSLSSSLSERLSRLSSASRADASSNCSLRATSPSDLSVATARRQREGMQAARDEQAARARRRGAETGHPLWSQGSQGRGQALPSQLGASRAVPGSRSTTHRARLLPCLDTFLPFQPSQPKHCCSRSSPPAASTARRRGTPCRARPRRCVPRAAGQHGAQVRRPHGYPVPSLNTRQPRQPWPEAKGVPRRGRSLPPDVQ